MPKLPKILKSDKTIKTSQLLKAAKSTRSTKSTGERIVAHADNAFAAANATRLGMKPGTRKVLVLGVVFVLIVFATMILPLYMFEHSMMEFTPAVFANVTAYNLDGLVTVLTGGGGWFVQRFMGVVVAAVAGAALGVTGSTYQGAFNNPLAAPKTLGVMAGGALGGLIFLIYLEPLGPHLPGSENIQFGPQVNAWFSTLSLPEMIWVKYGAALCSVVGCMLVVAIVIGLTTLIGRGRLSNIIVVIFGTVFSVSVTGVISYARWYYSNYSGDMDKVDALREIENYSMNRIFGLDDLAVVVLPIVICLVVVILLRNKLTLLSFGDDEAKSMGVNVNRVRYAMIIICTVMTGIAISFAGHIAFLGFISAHISRRLVGPDFRYLLPASVFVGGGFILLVYYLAQSGLPYTSPYAAGVICSILGPVLFLFIVLKQRGKDGSGGWR